MGRLSQVVTTALQSANGVAPNPYVTFFRSGVQDVEKAEASTPALTPLIDELVTIASSHHFSLDASAVNKFAQLLGEAHFMALCAGKNVRLNVIPRANQKTPDFCWSTPDGPIHFEVKTLSVVDGERGIDDALKNSFESQLDLEAQRTSGERISQSSATFAPYGAKGHKAPRLIAIIDNLLEKTRGNIKADQYALPHTFLVLNLCMLPPSHTDRDALRPVRWETLLSSGPVTGDLWMLAFGKRGMPIHDTPEFEGKPGVQGFFDKRGILEEYDFICGLLIVVHPWSRLAEVWGLFRETDWSRWCDTQNHPCKNVFKIVGEDYNDELDSFGFSLHPAADDASSAPDDAEPR